jgi:hypothetical protein
MPLQSAAVVVMLHGSPTSLRRTPLQQYASGQPVDACVDPIDHEIVITDRDDDDRDTLMRRTARAVAVYLEPEPPAPAAPVVEDITIVDLTSAPTCPLLPQSDSCPDLFSSTPRQWAEWSSRVPADVLRLVAGKLRPRFSPGV